MLYSDLQLFKRCRCRKEVSMVLGLDTVCGDINVVELSNSSDARNGLAAQTELLLADPQSKIEPCST